MPNFKVPPNPGFIEGIRMFETEDEAHADLFNAVVQSLINNDAYLKQTLEDDVLVEVAAGRASRMDVAIPTGGWSPGGADAAGMVYKDIAVGGVTGEMVPHLSILPADMGAAMGCGLSPTARTVDGALRVYARQAPVGEIHASLLLLKAHGQAGGIGAYSLPVATATKLGGVKIGDGVGVQADGTISVDSASIIGEAAAAEGDVGEMLDKVFGQG